MSKTLVPFRSALGDIWGDLEAEMSRAFGDGGRGGAANASGVFRPDMNMVETEDEFVLSLDLPGMTLEDIAIELNGDELTVSGHRANKSESKDGKWHRVESSYGKFFRTVKLGRGLLTEKVDAEYKDGVLTIIVPKAEEVKPRRIEIRA